MGDNVRLLFLPLFIAFIVSCHHAKRHFNNRPPVKVIEIPLVEIPCLPNPTPPPPQEKVEEEPEMQEPLPELPPETQAPKGWFEGLWS